MHSCLSVRWLLARLGIAIGLAVLSVGASAQGVMNTVPGIGFSSQSVPVFFGPASTSPLLRFSFGFATDEVLQPGILPDSLTLTLQDAAQRTTLLLVTMDAGGAVWAPVTPGTTPIPEGSLERQSIPYSSLTPVLSSRSAFALEFAVPADLVGESLTLYFDLFSNDDGVRSQAWFSKVEVVPEPSAWALLALGGGWILLSSRRNPLCGGEGRLQSMLHRIFRPTDL